MVVHTEVKLLDFMVWKRHKSSLLCMAGLFMDIGLVTDCVHEQIGTLLWDTTRNS